MKCTGKVVSVSRDWQSNQLHITFSLNERMEEEIEQIKDVEKLSIDVKKYHPKRSLDANAMLWACIQDISNATGEKPWNLYLKYLKEFGQYTYTVVKPKAVEMMKRMWRECEEVGEIEINGQKGIQMLCFFGSSTYNSKEFSKLLNGVIEDMKSLGLQPPPSADMRRALEQLEKREKNG